MAFLRLSPSFKTYLAGVVLPFCLMLKYFLIFLKTSESCDFFVKIVPFERPNFLAKSSTPRPIESTLDNFSSNFFAKALASFNLFLGNNL